MKVTSQQMIVELRVHIARHYKTQKNAAEAWNVKPSFVSAILRGKSKPNKKILSHLGLETEPYSISFKRVGKA